MRAVIDHVNQLHFHLMRVHQPRPQRWQPAHRGGSPIIGSTAESATATASQGVEQGAHGLWQHARRLEAHHRWQRRGPAVHLQVSVGTRHMPAIQLLCTQGMDDWSAENNQQKQKKKTKKKENGVKWGAVDSEPGVAGPPGAGTRPHSLPATCQTARGQPSVPRPVPRAVEPGHGPRWAAAHTTHTHRHTGACTMHRATPPRHC